MEDKHGGEKPAPGETESAMKKIPNEWRRKGNPQKKKRFQRSKFDEAPFSKREKSRGESDKEPSNVVEGESGNR